MVIQLHLWEWDRTSFSKGASGCCCQFVYDLTSPTRPMVASERSDRTTTQGTLRSTVIEECRVLYRAPWDATILVIWPGFSRKSRRQPTKLTLTLYSSVISHHYHFRWSPMPDQYPGSHLSQLRQPWQSGFSCFCPWQSWALSTPQHRWPCRTNRTQARLWNQYTGQEFRSEVADEWYTSI